MNLMQYIALNREKSKPNAHENIDSLIQANSPTYKKSLMGGLLKNYQTGGNVYPWANEEEWIRSIEDIKKGRKNRHDILGQGLKKGIASKHGVGFIDSFSGSAGPLGSLVNLFNKLSSARKKGSDFIKSQLSKEYGWENPDDLNKLKTLPHHLNAGPPNVIGFGENMTKEERIEHSKKRALMRALREGKLGTGISNI